MVAADSTLEQHAGNSGTDPVVDRDVFWAMLRCPRLSKTWVPISSSEVLSSREMQATVVALLCEFDTNACQKNVENDR